MGLLHKALSKKKEFKQSEELKVETTIKENSVSLSTLSGEEKENKFESQTNLDKVYHLVQTSGSVSLRNIPKILGISLDEAEKYARILSKDNLILLIYPAIGSPELRKKDYIKKEKVGNLLKSNIFKSKKIMVFVVILVVAFFGTFAFTSIFKDGEIAPHIEFPTIIESEKQETGKEVTLGTAFSGKGDYKCEFEKDKITAVYYIKDDKMRVETLVNGKNSIVIVRKDYTYTYLDTSDAWTKVKTLEDTVTPGSGKVPIGMGISISCFEAEIDDGQFEIDEENII